MNVSALHQIGVILRLTMREARRRRMLWLGLGMGLAFVAMYSVGFYFAFQDYSRTIAGQGRPFTDVSYISSIFLSAGLYVVNFLVVMVTVLTTVGTISGEIDSNTIHAIAAKPVRRRDVVIGKWLGHALLLSLYTTLLTLGLMLVVYLISGYVSDQPLGVLGVLVLESLVVLSLTMAGSASFSTLANGVAVFMLYGVAFVGGWVEQIGSLLESQTAADIGIASSLLMPSEALWRYAAGLLQGSGILSNFTPFSVASQPSTAFLIYAGLYTIGLLTVAILVFERRDF